MPTSAIIRKPGPEILHGQTTASLGKPDFNLALQQHKNYVFSLMSAGVFPEILEADAQFPDGCFVEDTAVILGEIALITRPGHPSREGETTEIAVSLTPFKQIIHLEQLDPAARMDGGDVLLAGKNLFIGLSKRTNLAGAKQLAKIAQKQSIQPHFIPVIEALHLKSSMSWVGENHLVLTPAYANQPDFSGFEKIITTPEETYAANCLLVNQTLFIAEGFPVIANQLNDLFNSQLKTGNFEIESFDLSEFRKIDGSLTCLSLLF